LRTNVGQTLSSVNPASPAIRAGFVPDALKPPS
jgi:hypothetical protein